MVSRNRSLLYSDVDGGKLDTDVSFQRAGGSRVVLASVFACV